MLSGKNDNERSSPRIEMADDKKSHQIPEFYNVRAEKCQLASSLLSTTVHKPTPIPTTNPNHHQPSNHPLTTNSDHYDLTRASHRSEDVVPTTEL